MKLYNGNVRVRSTQPVEKVFFLSLRAKRDNLAFNKINGLEIASSQKLLLAMTCDRFFNSLYTFDKIIMLLILSTYPIKKATRGHILNLCIPIVAKMVTGSSSEAAISLCNL